MANFGDSPSEIKLLAHQAVRRNLTDAEPTALLYHSNRLQAEPGRFNLKDRGDWFEAYATDRQDIIVRVRSSDYAGGLTKGTVVYIGGATGNRPYVLKADADSEATSSKTFGILADNIGPNEDGLCCVEGVLTGLDLRTSNGWADGDKLWLSQTAGEFTKTVPAEPAHSVFIGTISRAHPTLGTVIIQIQNGYELNELHGVLLDDPPADGDVLTYETSSGLWKNKPTQVGVSLLTSFYSPVNATDDTVDVMSTTVSANTLNANGECLRAKLSGNITQSGVDNGLLTVHFAGTDISVTVDTSGAFTVEAMIIRASSTTAKYVVTFLTENGANVNVSQGAITSGLDFTTNETFKFILFSAAVDFSIDGNFGHLEHLPL